MNEKMIGIKLDLEEPVLFPIDFSSVEKYKESVEEAIEQESSWGLALMPDYSTKDCNVFARNLYLRNVKKNNDEINWKIVKAISEIVMNPTGKNCPFIKRLEMNLSKYWRYKIGHYRLAYTFNHDDKTIILEAFATREKIYEILS